MVNAELAADRPSPRRFRVFAPGVLRRLGVRGLLVLVYFASAIPAGFFRAYADDFGLPVRSHFNAFEAVLLTDKPNIWLQSGFLQFRFLWNASWIIYASWFTLPLIATMPNAGAGGKQPWRLIGFLMLTYYLGMPFFALYPLEPPWMHNPDIIRIIHQLHPEVVGKDENVFAAMPSLHVALPTAASLWYGWRHPFGRVLLCYASLIGLSVTYGGDHYVADVAGGFALAAGSYWVVRATGLPLLREHALPDERALGAGRARRERFQAPVGEPSERTRAA